jgi:superfamily I DNA/RNA helicase
VITLKRLLRTAKDDQIDFFKDVGEIEKDRQRLKDDFRKEKSSQIFDARDLIINIKQSIEDLFDNQKELVEFLSDLYEKFPGLHEHLNRNVEFPNERDIEKIKKMKDSIDEVSEQYRDQQYLADIIGAYPE